MRASLLALAFLATPALAQTVDQTDPQATAMAVLKALAVRDGATLAGLLNETNQDLVELFATLSPDDPTWAEMLNGATAAGVAVFDGSVRPPKYGRDDNPEVVVMPFAYEEADDSASAISAGCRTDCRYLVIVLTRDGAGDTTWGFEDVNSYPTGTYDRAPEMN